MRNARRFGGALLAVLLLLAATACTPARLLESVMSGAAQESAAPAQTEPAAEPTAEPAAEPTAEPTAEPAAEPTQEPDAPTVAEALAGFSHGTWEGLTFTSDLAGLALTLPDESWTIATDEDLAEMMNLGQEAVGDDLSDLEKAMANLTNIQDMMAQNPQTGESILLMFENLAIIPGASDYTAEAFAEELAQGLEETDALPYIVGEIGTQTLGGNEYVVVPATVDGYELCQHYLIRREGNFMVELILTGVGEEGIEGLLAMFA